MTIDRAYAAMSRAWPGSLGTLWVFGGCREVPPGGVQLAGCQLKRLMSMSQMPSRRNPMMPMTTTMDESDA